MAFHRSSSPLSLGETPVENLFIQEYLPIASGDQIRVYLTGLMHSYAARDISCASFARDLGLSVSYLRQLFEYWKQAGLVDITDDPDCPDEFHITYHSMRALVRSGARSAEPERNTDTRLAHLVVSLKGSNVNSREFSFLQDFVATAENGFAIAEQILTLYYKDRGGKSFLEVERILNDIKKQEVTTLEDALLLAHRILNKKDIYKRIKLLISDRATTTPAEQSKIDQWIDDFGFDEQKILSLVTEFSTCTVNPNIAFIHTLMKEHYESVSDPRQAFRREVKQLLTGGNNRINQGEAGMIDRWLDELGLTESEIRTAIETYAPERQVPSIDYIDKRIRGTIDPTDKTVKSKRRKSLKKIDSFSDDELEERLLSRSRNKI